MDDFSCVKRILSAYPEIEIGKQLQDRFLLFHIADKRFLLFFPDSRDVSRPPLILIDSTNVQLYPHIICHDLSKEDISCSPEGKYRYICLHEQDELVNALLSYEEKIADEIDRLLHLLHMNSVQREREYQKEFLLHWNNASTGTLQVDVFLQQTEKISVLDVYYQKNRARVIERGIILHDLQKIEKNQYTWQEHIEENAFLIPIIDNRGIIPPNKDERWTVKNIKNIICSKQIQYISCQTYEAVKTIKVTSKDTLLIFLMKINDLSIAFSLKLKCKSRSNRTLLEKIQNDAIAVEPLYTQRRDYAYSQEIIGNRISNFPKRRVLLVGAGSLGSYVAPELVKNGWKNVTIYDNDKLSAENVMRWNYAFGGVGLNKTACLKILLESIHPEVHVKVENKRLTVKALLKELEEIDLIIFTIGSSDEQLTFNKVLQEKRIRIPVLYVWLEAGGQYSHILLVNYQEGNGCYQCLFTDENGNLVNNRASLGIVAPTQVIRNGCGGTRVSYGTNAILRTTAVLLNILDDIEKGKLYSTKLFSITQTEVFEPQIPLQQTKCRCCGRAAR